MQRGTIMQNFDIDLSNELKTKPNPNSEIFLEVSNAVRDNGGYCCCEIEKTDDAKKQDFLQGIYIRLVSLLNSDVLSLKDIFNYKT